MSKLFYKVIDKACLGLWEVGNFVRNFGMKIEVHAMRTCNRFNDRRLYGKR